MQQRRYALLLITASVSSFAKATQPSTGALMHQSENNDPPLTIAQEASVKKLSASDIQTLDEALLSNADGHWRKVAFVVAKTMLQLKPRPEGVPDVYYAQRVAAMVTQGKLESQGNLRRMRFSEIRLRAHPGENPGLASLREPP